jgi:ElaB/YqjD/DUF883 family membrane-anchored ribosome-binding protein
MGEATDEMKSRNDLNDTALESSAIRQDESPIANSADTAEIRSRIEQTRVDLGETIDALQEKLDPARIAEQVKDQIKEKATEAFDTAKNTVREATIGRAEKMVSSVSDAVSDATGRAGAAVKDSGASVVQYIRDNPVPVALVGIGLGMLALNKRNTGQSSYRSSLNTRPGSYDPYPSDRSGEDQASWTDRAQNVVSGVAETARGAADATRRQFQDVRDQAAQGARAATGTFRTTLDENPMALGVAALAAGVIVGLTVPATHVEDEYMGEARDRLVDQAKSVAQEAAQKIQHVAAEAGNTAKEAAQKEGLIGGESVDPATRL